MGKYEYETYEKFKEAKSKGDLIGSIYNSDLYERLGFQRVESIGEKESWNYFMKILSEASGGKEKAEKIGELAVTFGNEREETGFRIGFHLAMRICMEGLSRGFN